ncbi:MAG: anthranilate phosphoribosyltransferase [Mariprofundaceae bacterium]|nr:anthranilate phosphoribosyltransferase [Mariprofundaceae bacterium]
MINASELAQHLSTVARGQHGKRDLNQAQAFEAYQYLLHPSADPLQLGAFLIAQRIKGESPAEIAGFVQASQHAIHDFNANQLHHAIDMPCYAGKRRDTPLHLVAALEASQQGIPIVIHGIADIAGRLSAWQALSRAGVQRAGSLQEAQPILAKNNIVYMDLTDICPPLYQMLQLRERLGVRSCANTVARLLNPLRCTAQINGFFHHPYGTLMAKSNQLLDQQNSLLFMGAEGEPELYASRQRLLLSQQGSKITRWRYPSADVEPYPREHIKPSQLTQQFLATWHGQRTEKDNIVLNRMQQAFKLVFQQESAHDWQQDEKERTNEKH